MMCAQCERIMILLQKHDNDIIKSLQIYIPKTGVEQIGSNVGFYFYLYPLGTWFKEAPKKPFNLHVAHVHPCVIHVHLCGN